jgi:hypothetical protein
MARLHPTLALGSGESPQSYVSRLALVNGIESARIFCTDMALTFQAIVDGDASALAELADLAGAPLAALRNNALRREKDGWRLHGERVQKLSLRRDRLHVCPACFAADADSTPLPPETSVYGRTVWLLDHIRTCAKHSLGLVEVAPGKPSQSQDFALLAGRSAASLIRQAKDAPRREPSALERYLIARLDGDVGQSPWLNGLEFSVAARTSEMIGTVATRGRKPKLGAMSDDDWRNAGDAGFKIAAGGEAAIRAWLAELQATYPYSGSATEGPQAQFGRFFTWLSWGAPDAGFDPVRDLVRRHIIETLPLGPDDVVLGKKVEKRILHSIHTASSELGVHPKRLRKILAAKGLLPANHDERSDHAMTFSADAAQELLDKTHGSLMLRQIQTYLGAGRVQARLLMEQGFITPFVSTEEHGQGGTSHAFAKADLDGFLARLFDGAVEVAAPQPPAYSIQEAAKRANCGAGEIIQLILDKKLAWVGRRAGVDGYAAVLVDADEIKRHVRGPALDGLTAEMMHKEMHTTARVVNALIAAGHLPTQRVINPLNRCPVDITSRADFEAFRQTYATLFDLAHELGVHFNVLKARLIGQGVQPALDKATFGATFYRRADIRKLGLPASSRVPRTAADRRAP